MLKQLITIFFLSFTPLSHAEKLDFSLIYNRADWKHWIDKDGDCQNTRAEILIARSMGNVKYNGYKKCSVKSGLWIDFYTGEKIVVASELDIDHVVALKWAQGHGGDKWSLKLKRDFSNDPLNLVVTAKKINRSKGEKGPDEWETPKKSLNCKYVKQFLAVVFYYKLHLVPTEKISLQAQLRRCSVKN